jgi:N-acetyl-gamma-glutamyl-phosphate reductase
MIRAAVIGAAGYTGGETLRLLLQHPHVDASAIVAVSSSHAGKPLASAHSDLWGYTDLGFAAQLVSLEEVDVVFLCMGHGMSKAWMSANDVPDHVKVIDLSMDFRIMSADSPFVYGLPEKYRTQLSTANRVANPGCLATSVELALLPLAETSALHGDIIAQSMTGSTGAGQQPIDTTHFSWRYGNVNAYKVFHHQHEAEIKQTLGLHALSFIPLRGPFSRGIYTTCVMPGEYDVDHLQQLYSKFYADHPFVVIRDTEPDVKSIVNTNMCHIGITASDSALLVVSVIDNLMKGASGQAVQNMNIMFGFEETAGLFTKASAF